MQLLASPLGLEATPDLFASDARDKRALPRAQHSWTQLMPEAHEDPCAGQLWLGAGISTMALVSRSLCGSPAGGSCQEHVVDDGS